MALTQEAADRLWERSRFSQFVEKAQNAHNFRYTYPTAQRNDKKQVQVICSIHGAFFQRAEKHLSGQGCPSCSNKLTPEQYLAKYQALHPTLDFSLALYSGSKGKIKLTCPKHGQFEKTANALASGQGCPDCGVAIRAKASTRTAESLAQQFAQVHGDRYTYDWSTYTKSTSTMKMHCLHHGEFWQKPDFHRTGVGCPACGYERVSDWHSSNGEDFVQAAKRVHGDAYDYSRVVYYHSKQDVMIVCPEHGEFLQKPNNHLNGSGCPQCCNNRSSKAEAEISDFVRSLGFTPSLKGRVGRYEVDIYVPWKKVGIEYNGLYWHGDHIHHRPENHLATKTQLATQNGVRLLQVFEDEWLTKTEIVKERIRNAFGVVERRLDARKCELVEVLASEARQFHRKHHLQGEGHRGCKHYGLTYQGELVSVASFGKSYLSSADYECYRFSSSCLVRGSFSKLLKFFLKKTPDCKSLVSYADLRWGQGQVYEKAGFTRLEDTQPGYFWCKGGQRINRHVLMKHKLKKVLKDFDPELTEDQNLRRNGYWKVYDCGHAKYILSPQKEEKHGLPLSSPLEPHPVSSQQPVQSDHDSRVD